jgi:hypothetical protein
MLDEVSPKLSDEVGDLEHPDLVPNLQLHLLKDYEPETSLLAVRNQQQSK